MISSPTQSVSSVFASTAAGQAALTVLISGRGQIEVNPRANVYSTNQTVTLTATPDPGQSFLHWSGDASGAANPLTITMDQSKVVAGEFSSPVSLSANYAEGDGLTPQGFRFTLVGDPQAVWQILATTNFAAWQMLGTVTNSQGQVQFTDPGAVSLPRRFYRSYLPTQLIHTTHVNQSTGFPQ